MFRRSHNATSAATAPIANGMRQPHSRSCSSVRNTRCSAISTANAIRWPITSVTYWKLDQKPRCPRVAISLR